MIVWLFAIFAVAVAAWAQTVEWRLKQLHRRLCKLELQGIKTTVAAWSTYSDGEDPPISFGSAFPPQSPPPALQTGLRPPRTVTHSTATIQT